MNPWNLLVEARIHEWRQRPEKPSRPDAVSGLSIPPLELQLLRDALERYEAAASAVDQASRAALVAEADALGTQLQVVLETTGRAMAARHFADQLLAARNRAARRDADDDFAAAAP